jgi:hypothetical protein
LPATRILQIDLECEALRRCDVHVETESAECVRVVASIDEVAALEALEALAKLAAYPQPGRHHFVGPVEDRRAR